MLTSLMILADGASTQPAAWFARREDFLMAIAVGALSLVVGLLAFVIVRKLVIRARLVTPWMVAVISLAIYFANQIANTDRMALSDPTLANADWIAVWVKRIFVAAIVYCVWRAIDRLIIVPVLSRGGKTPIAKFVHQVINIIIVLFAVLGYGSWAFQWDIDKFLAGSAVVSIVLGLALQETLGNFFSGLVMQASSPFNVGDWIECAGVEGRVVEMTWRAVTIHTLEDNHVLVPNGTIAKETIINYHAPTSTTARTMQVGLEYDLPPAEAVAVLKAAALETHGVVAEPEPFIYLQEFGDSSIVYNVKFWISEPEKHKKIEHYVRMNAWYRLKQKGYNIPFPIRTVEHVGLRSKSRDQQSTAVRERLRAIERCGILSPLSDEQKRQLADSASDVSLGPSQSLFRQGDAGDSFYIIRAGQADVSISTEGFKEAKVATLGPGDFFGEMSALTGEPRSATIRANGNLTVVEIHKDELKSIFETDGTIMEKMSQVIAERNVGRQKTSETANAEAKREVVTAQRSSILSRMKTFFTKWPK
jgi:small-conductance mechanosensitive channel